MVNDAVQTRTQATASHHGCSDFRGLEMQRRPRTCEENITIIRTTQTGGGGKEIRHQSQKMTTTKDGNPRAV